MKLDKMFKIIWNVNGLILFLALSLGTLSIGYQLTQYFLKNDYTESPVLNLADDDTDEEKWTLGYPHNIDKTDFYYIALESEKLSVETERGLIRNFSGGSYPPTRAKNVIFIDAKTNTPVWLFKSVNQLIIDMQSLIVSEYSTNSATKGMYYEVINNDTNQDNVLDKSDKRTFALSKIDGSGYTEIIDGYNKIIKSKVNNDGDLFVLYIEDNEVYSMIVDLNTFKITDKKPLPKISDL